MAEKESKTKNFVLRVDADTLAAIEKWAADEFRSTNGQLQWIIAEALKKHGRGKTKKKGLPQRLLRGDKSPSVATDASFASARRGGTSESDE